MNSHLNGETAVKAFEQSWNELIDDYPKERELSAFCSEADVQMHLSHKLLTKLSPWSVHIELPIPIDVDLFSYYLRYTGKIAVKYSIRPDIALLDPSVPDLYLIAELKYTPIYWNLSVLSHDYIKTLNEKAKKAMKEGLEGNISYLDKIRSKEPSSQDINEAYLSNIASMVTVLNDFKDRQGKTVHGYLCVLDEIYPDIENILQREIKKYDPFQYIKVKAKHFDVLPSLKTAQKYLE